MSALWCFGIGAFLFAFILLIVSGIRYNGKAFFAGIAALIISVGLIFAAVNLRIWAICEYETYGKDETWVAEARADIEKKGAFSRFYDIKGELEND